MSVGRGWGHWLVLLVVLCVPLLGACGGAAATPTPKGGEVPAKLRVGLIPNQAPDTLKAQYEPFRAYLEKALGVPVELFVASDYNAVVEAMINDRLDAALFGGVTYVQAHARADIYPIVTEIDRLTHTTKYTSVIVTRADGPIQTLADLGGKRFAFGDINSTSGSLYPRLMLEAAGYKFTDNAKDPPAGLKEVIYTGAHDATVQAVLNGSVDAGGMEERILLRLEDAGTVDKTKIRVLKQSDPIEGYPWAVRGKLDKAFVERLTNAFLNLKDPDILKIVRNEGYARISDADYAYTREQCKHFGLVPK